MYTLGIDIGSTTTKCCILKDGQEIVAKSLKIGGMGTPAVQEAVDEIWIVSGLSQAEMYKTVVTGYGRMRYEGADKEVSELTCHGLGGRLLFPSLRTLIDIGGQDAKVICLSESGRMTNFVMNDKCAAGTGRFLDVMANILRIDVEDMEHLAQESTQAAQISSTCTVFAESEVISRLANGVQIPDLIAGICQSVVSRVAALARRAGVTPQVAMSGGVACNGAIRKAMAAELGVDIAYDPLAQYFGAIGAAIYATKL